jgi:hypothetical protein
VHGVEGLVRARRFDGEWVCGGGAQPVEGEGQAAPDRNQAVEAPRGPRRLPACWTAARTLTAATSGTNMERLSPPERVVFVLHDVFEVRSSGSPWFSARPPQPAGSSPPAPGAGSRR